MIHAYVICEPATAASLPPRRGLGGARVRVAVADGLAVVYSRHRSLQPSPALVMAHERVVEAAMAHGTVLPLRFGTRLGSEQELLAAISARHDELVSALDGVRGRVEIGLRVIPRGRLGQERGGRDGLPGGPGHGGSGRDREGDTKSGRAYLLARVAESRLAERAKHEIHLPLARLATAHVLTPRLTPPAILVASYLVPEDQVAHFKTRARQLAAGVEEVQSFITGPWPPYNFVALPQPQPQSRLERQP